MVVVVGDIGMRSLFTTHRSCCCMAIRGRLLLQSIGNVFANLFQFVTLGHLKGDGFVVVVVVVENDLEQGFGIRYGTDLMFGHSVPFNTDRVGILSLIAVRSSIIVIVCTRSALRIAVIRSKDKSCIGTRE